MELLLCDLSFSNICMLPPKLLENNHYSFPLEYSNEEQKIPLIFTSNQLYHLYLRQNVCELHIKEKNELQFFNELYEYLLNLLYDKHDNWFEHKFEKQKFKSMFKDYLYPNIQENAVNIKCSVDSSLIEKINENNTYEIYPTFKLNSIVFNEIEFLIDLQLINATFLEIEQKDEINNSSTNVEEKTEDIEVSQPSVEKSSPSVEKSSTSVENSSLDINQDDILEEINVNINDNDEDTDVDLNESDYFIIFKIIQSNIKDNFSKTLVDLLNERNINTKNIDIQSIVYDSDDNEDSEDEFLNNDNFEESYKNIV